VYLSFLIKYWENMRAGVPGHVQALRRPARPAPREDVPSVRLDLDGAAAMLLLMLLDVLRTLDGGVVTHVHYDRATAGDVLAETSS